MLFEEIDSLSLETSREEEKKKAKRRVEKGGGGERMGKSKEKISTNVQHQEKSPPQKTHLEENELNT